MTFRSAPSSSRVSPTTHPQPSRKNKSEAQQGLAPDNSLISSQRSPALSRRRLVGLGLGLAPALAIGHEVVMAPEATAAPTIDLASRYGVLPGRNVTAAVNRAIAAHPGATLVLRPSATPYLVDAVASIKLATAGTRLVLTGATLKVIPNAATNYAAVLMTAPNTAVIGGQIIGDVRTHRGTTGEWGHGISIREGARGARVDNVRIAECWGDGIYVNAPNQTGITINRVRCDYNRRQGISIVASTGTRITKSTMSNTGKIKVTAPGFGIDVEPNPGRGNVEGLVVEDCTMSGNLNGGVCLVQVANSTSRATFTRCTITGNGRRGVLSVVGGRGPALWTVRDSVVERNGGVGVECRSAGLVLLRNRIGANRAGGLNLLAPAAVTGGSVSGNTGTGLTASAAAAGSVIHGVTFSRNSVSGVHTAGRLVMDGCVATANGQYGFALLEGSGGSVLTRCRAEMNSRTQAKSEFTVRSRSSLLYCTSYPKPSRTAPSSTHSWYVTRAAAGMTFHQCVGQVGTKSHLYVEPGTKVNITR